MSKTIIVVDDFQVSNEIVAAELRKEGYEVFTTRNAKAALVYFDGREVDLLITDYQMPMMNGIELIRKVRKIQKYEYIPILLLSVIKNEAKKKEAFDENITGWIAKPFSIDKIMPIVKKALG